VSILAVLKAGGAYVPFEPSHPKARLHFIIEDTKANIILTQSKLERKFRDYIGTKLHSIEDASEIISEMPRGNIAFHNAHHSLAYVIYTSGSTGNPKGVMIDHKNLSHYINYAKSAYAMPKGQVVLHSSVAFDMSITSIFLPLVQGNSICILPQDSQADYLGEILKKNNALSFIKMTPSHLKILKSQLTTKSINKQRSGLIIGGENLLMEDIGPWLDISPQISIFNEYGPTEATVGCCVFKITQSFKPSSSSVSIGHPIANTQIYILDKFLNPVPVGVIGELYIGGDGLSRGYLNRPDLTAEKFIPNPFIDETPTSCERLYRTGDFARYLPNGNIEFLGRIDDQVKIRGYRIELGEIESILSAHGDLDQALVIMQENVSGEKQLVAYVVSGDFRPSCTELRQYLREKMPDYMIPAHFIYIEKIPLTSNGKINFKALPNLNSEKKITNDEYIPPQTLLEKTLCNIWAEILKTEKVGVQDNFFMLGGHSLLGIQLISRIKTELFKTVSLKKLFKNPTIQGLSAELGAHEKEDKSITIRPCGITKDIPLSFAQQRLWLVDQLMPESPLYNVPMALRLKGKINIGALEKAFSALIERHEVLRTYFEINDEGQLCQIIGAPYKTQLYPEDYSFLSNKEKEIFITNEAGKERNAPFDLSKGPLLRTKLFRMNLSEHVLLITMHHIVTDAWSMGIFIKELSNYYSSYKKGEELNLTPLQIQYKDFAVWQRSWLQGDELGKQLNFWSQKLTNIPGFLSLATDKERPKELTYKGGLYRSKIEGDIVRRLKTLAHEKNCSLFIVLLSAFQVLLHKYTNQNDIVIGSPVANRHYKGVEELLGFFVNTLPIRSFYSEDGCFTDHLLKTRETALNAYEHQDLPFEQIIEHLKIRREMNRNPIFQVLFGLQYSQSLQLDEADVSSIELGYDAAKLDLAVTAIEEEQQDIIWFEYEYSKDLFYERTVRQISNHYIRSLDIFSYNPETLLRDYNFFTEEVHNTQFNEFNNTKVDYVG
jgi:amino acid adenylation domain-containing protein